MRISIFESSPPARSTLRWWCMVRAVLLTGGRGRRNALWSLALWNRWFGYYRLGGEHFSSLLWCWWIFILLYRWIYPVNRFVILPDMLVRKSWTIHGILATGYHGQVIQLKAHCHKVAAQFRRVVAVTWHKLTLFYRRVRPMLSGLWCFALGKHRLFAF